MVMVDVRDEPDILATNPEIIDGEQSAEAANSVIVTEEPSRSREGRTAHWYYSMPFPGVRYYGFDQRPVVSKRFSPAKAGRGAGA